MSLFKSYKDSSKENWGVRYTDGNPPTIERDQLFLGCLQRIASATESQAESMQAMSADYVQLRRDKDNYLKWWQAEEDENQALRRQLSALKGVITKKDKLIKQLKDAARNDGAAPAAADAAQEAA